MNNIDKDIEILKEFTESSCCLYSQEEIIEATKKVLSELDKHQEAHKILVKLNSNLKSELETYKKIAEKLAEQILLQIPTTHNIVTVNSIKMVIDEARKEVEKDEKSSTK